MIFSPQGREERKEGARRLKANERITTQVRSYRWFMFLENARNAESAKNREDRGGLLKFAFIIYQRRHLEGNELRSGDALSPRDLLTQGHCALVEHNTRCSAKVDSIKTNQTFIELENRINSSF